MHTIHTRFLTNLNKHLKIISGGQTGVDRAALDIANALGINYGGWCPKGGLAEDMPNPPGLLHRYPALRATAISDYFARTRLNVEDSSATLIIASSKILAMTGGTGYTIQYADLKQKPCHIVLLTKTNTMTQIMYETTAWMNDLFVKYRWGNKNADKITLNIAGPRASKAPDIYREAYCFLESLLHDVTITNGVDTNE